MEKSKINEPLNIKLYQGNDAMEAAMLRAILLFNNKVKKAKREDMMQRVILSIIIYGAGEFNEKQILEILRSSNKCQMSEGELKHKLGLLKQEKLIDSNTSGNYYCVEQDKDDNFFQRLSEDTEQLITNIIEKVEKLAKKSYHNKPQLRTNIQKSLSVYLYSSGLKFFGIDNIEDGGYDDIIKTSMVDLDNNWGKYLVQVIGDTIDKPSDFEKSVLTQWARAFVLTQVLKLDPQLANFKMTKIAGKTFVLDTDVMLNLLTKKARWSAQYKEMIEKLRSFRCNFVVPKEIIDEVKGNVKSARFKMTQNGPQYLEMHDEQLEGPKSNVFIEDYVKIVRSEQKDDFTFDLYIDNICHRKTDDILYKKVSKLLGYDLKQSSFELMVTNEDIRKLKEEILSLAKYTPKGIERSDSNNEERSEVDARLYATIENLVKDEQSSETLGYKWYLLTRSERTIVAAKHLKIYEKPIVCHPQALIAVLEEIGNADDANSNIINLFDNPYLVYTANEVWDKVEPLINDGHLIKYKDFDVLKFEVDLNFDEWLTCEDSDQREALARKYTERGLSFLSDYKEKVDTIEQLRQERSFDKQTISELKEEVTKTKEQLKKERGRNHYERQRELGLRRDIRKNTKGPHHR